MEHWKFYKDQNHKWRWRCVDPAGTVVSDSGAWFFNQIQCLADAIAHGYLPQLSPRLDRKPKPDLHP
jgi:hypothetical protein